jgi:hypothetical protein
MYRDLGFRLFFFVVDVHRDSMWVGPLPKEAFFVFHLPCSFPADPIQGLNQSRPGTSGSTCVTHSRPVFNSLANLILVSSWLLFGSTWDESRPHCLHAITSTYHLYIIDTEKGKAILICTHKNCKYMNSSSHINPTEYDQAWKKSNYMQSKTIHDLTNNGQN